MIIIVLRGFKSHELNLFLMIKTGHKSSVKISLIIFLLQFFTVSSVFSQIAADDPIVAMLDSLATKKFVEKAWAKPTSPKNKKYQYAPDSIPRADEFTYESRLAKLDAASPFDLQYNSTVKAYIDMYAYNRRGQVSKMLGISQLYYPMFEEVLDKYNIPLELKHLAVIESALNPLAKSVAGAAGLWQFMYPTAKMNGLVINSYIDERFDPYKETIAAAEYLQFLYKMFGDWQMVLAAYNGGPGTVSKAIRRSGGKKTYWEIRPYLPRETQGYVPAFIAANYIMNYYPEHNIYPAVPKKNYFELDTIVVKETITFEQLSSILDVPFDEIQYFNPVYKKNVIPSGGNILTLPKTYIGKFVSNEAEIYAMLQKQSDSKKLMSETVAKEKPIYHTVVGRENLNTIASKYGVSVADIKVWNFIGKKGIKPGRKLLIYVKEQEGQNSSTDNTNPTDNNATVDNNSTTNKIVEKKTIDNNKKTLPKKTTYTVKKGDNLYKIAKDHGLTIDQLRKLNRFNKNSRIRAGQKLKVK